MTTLYATMADAMFVVDDTEGDAPTLQQRFDGHDFECVTAHPHAPDRVLVGTFDAGLHRSTDSAKTFDRVGTDAFGSESVMAVAVDPSDPDTVWAGTEPSAVYRSTDGGETWTPRHGLTDLPSAEEWYFPPRPHTHHVRWLEPDPHDPARLYVGIEAGAFVRTDDGGDTWHDRPSGSRIDNHSLSTHPDAPGRVYAAAGDGYAESTDGGETWTHPQEGLDHRYCWSVAVAPDDPDAVVLSSASGPRAAHSPPDATSYVYRRTAEKWVRSMEGLPAPEGLARAALAVDDDGVFYALSNRGIHRSENGGRSWTALDVEWPDAFVSQTPSGLAVV